MKLTLLENVNTNSIVLIHKIGLETITLLEDRENLLNSEIKIYTMVSLVDNFSEGDLLEDIANEEDDFSILVENVIEPKFFEILDKYNYKETYENILNDVEIYLKEKEYKSNTLIGIIKELNSFLTEQNWEDLKFFFQKVSQEATSILTSKEGIDTLNKIKEEVGLKKEPDKNVTSIDEGDKKIQELIAKFKVEKEELAKENEINNEEGNKDSK